MAGSSTFFVLSPGLPEDFYDAIIKPPPSPLLLLVVAVHRLLNMHTLYGYV